MTLLNLRIYRLLYKGTLNRLIVFIEEKTDFLTVSLHFLHEDLMFFNWKK
ncbi:hypothetical protein HNP36_001735 [Chryseobacterium shigense]|uniref:Uncharacterized protein n=1 Tax=Chryseobacterium shigense TaxID=297244 RepID=A0A841NF54_9FLAO|nr:hypothetical protein [Chryseobacterium shigense]